jgi:hypothetical protein
VEYVLLSRLKIATLGVANPVLHIKRRSISMQKKESMLDPNQQGAFRDFVVFMTPKLTHSESS